MNPAARAAAERFRDDRMLHGYTRGKTAWDPAYPAAADLLRDRPLPVLDIGCGVGILGAYLREAGCRQPILGIEPDASKVAQAVRRVGAFYPEMEFRLGDAQSLPDFSGDVVVLDVLHYMERPVQAEVLREISVRLAPGGMALIRTTFRDRSWRYAATLMEETFVRLSGWIRGGRCLFPTREEVLNPLRDAGLDVDVQPMWGRTPFNSHLVVARRGGRDGR